MPSIPTDKVRTVIEKIILPKYPFIEIKSIIVRELTHSFFWDFNFSIPYGLEHSTKLKIIYDMESVFKMLGLNEVEKYKESKNGFDVNFYEK